MVNLTSKSVCSLEHSVEESLAANKVQDSLYQIYAFVEKIITEPLCAAQVIASQNIDKLCLKIGRSNLSNLNFEGLDFFSNAISRKKIVYIVSRLQKSGGHTRLVLDFIRSQPEKDHIILATGVVGTTDQSFLDSPAIKGFENVFFKAAPKGNLQSRLTWLQRNLLVIAPEHTYLFNHHQDSVAAAALVPELGLKGSFCHHGDHHLCLGVHMDHLTHIDLHPMGYHYCRDELGIENQFLPLTFEDKGTLVTKLSFTAERKLITATAARSNKVEIPYYVSYVDLIPRVLKATGGHHIHIGKLTPWALRRMRSQMRKLGVDAGQFVYIEWTPSVWRSLQEHNVDVYLASFPYGAGLTLIEALGAGIPVVMHQHIYSRVLSGLELAYEQAFSWSDPEKLLSYLTALNPEDLVAERALARQHYERFHRQELLEEYFQRPDKWNLPVPPLAKDFKPRWDEWAAWVESQLNIKRLLYRFAYRTGRRMRAFVSQRLGG